MMSFFCSAARALHDLKVCSSTRLAELRIIRPDLMLGVPIE
jgi:hypothetical protein